MKTLVNKLSLLLIFALFISCKSFAYENEKVIKKSFKASNDTELSIRNSFGFVNIESYKGTEIQIEVRVWAKGSSESKVDKFINSIEIDFSEDGGSVKAKTSNISNNGKVKRFEVNYTVKMPEKAPLFVDLSFGEVILKNHKGKVELELAHGSINAEKLLNPKNEFDIRHSNGKVTELNNAKIDIQHSNLEITSSSNLYLENQFSTVKINELTGDVRADIQHGNLFVDTMDKKFDTVNINADFSNVKLNISAEASYELTYKGSFSSVDLPTNFERTERDKDYTSEYLKGNVNGNKSKLKVKISHSNIHL